MPFEVLTYYMSKIFLEEMQIFCKYFSKKTQHIVYFIN